MKKINENIRLLILLGVFLCCSVVSSFGQAYPYNDVPNHTGGDYWFSFLPPSHAAWGTTNTGTGGGVSYIRYGVNLVKDWSNPMGQYPNGYWVTGYWVPAAAFMIYDPDTTFCPAKVGGATNVAYIASMNNATVAGTQYANFVTGLYRSQLVGAADPTRTYVKLAAWVNAATRQQMISEIGYVTNVGVDVKIRTRQFTAPNWNNFNDFLIQEYSFKNTGNVDINMDGTFEKTNHKIVGMTFNYNDGGWNPVTSTYGGTRGSTWGTNDARCSGYFGDLDPNNEPWDFIAGFNGCLARYNPKLSPPVIPKTGNIDMGFAPAGTIFYYSDIWQGSSFLSAKKGGLPTDNTKSNYASDDKPLMWGTPAIGTGAQKGWFTSGGVDRNFYWTSGNPKQSFLTCMGVFCKDGGVNGVSNTLNYLPDPNFFASGLNAQIETWVPKKTSGFTAAERPRGSRKSLSLVTSTPEAAFYQIVEDGTKEGTTKYTPTTSAGYPAWGHMGSEGSVDWNNFDADTYMGIGPFNLDVNEEMTITFVLAAGFRMEGLQKAIRASRYAYQQSYQIPVTPPVPILHIASTTTPTAMIRWDKGAETDPNFAGYKIWKSASFNKYTYLDAGMRLIDHYQEQMVVGADKTPYKMPINPQFNAGAFNEVAHSAYKGLYPGDTWGVWELILVVPKADLAKYTEAVPALKDTKYVYEDKGIALGIKYWYYISAYSEGTYTGPAGETTNRIETHSINRNGATGLWCGVFPWASSWAAKYPTADADKEAIGAPLYFFTQIASEDALKTGTLQVGVRPNPYKEISNHDNFLQTYDHKVLFYNLPTKCNITILDVSGKLIQKLHFTETSTTTKGSMFWNMFSKDGQEVASGLYIYYVEYDGGTQTGKFAILR